MKVKPEQLQKLARTIYNDLTKANLITVHSSDTAVVEKIAGVLLSDAKMEDDIEKQAKTMMDQYKTQVQSGQIDYHKMYSMIKKQLIKDKKFII